MFDLIPAQLPKDAWEKIVYALEDYIINTEEVLKTQNVGDTPWARLDEFKAVRNDVLLYVLGGTYDSRLD